MLRKQLLKMAGTVARQVQINGNITENIGTNDTMLTCNFTLDQGDDLVSVWILATNMTLCDFENVASFDPDYGAILQSFGKVLFGNASLSSVYKSSKSVSLSFDDLNCKHSRLYKCRLFVKRSDNPSITTESEAIGISIQVPPTTPDSVLLVRNPAVVSVPSTTNVDYSSASPSTAVTSNENETVSASETEKQNTEPIFNNVKIPTPGPNTTSSLLQEDISTNSSYRTTTYYIPKLTTSQGIAEGDNITVVCTGDVGNPPGEHLFQKYRNGKIFHMHEKVYATSNSDMYENCSYYRTSNLTFQVSADDNNVVIRCVVNSSMADPAMYVETAPIEVYYPVRMPTIINYPNKTDYVLGEDTSIHLACKSDGYPKPSYFWYKENPKQQVSSNENFTLTNLNITNSGTYTCKVNNTFHGDVYQNATIVNIKIINTADKTTPSTSGSGLNKAKDNGTVIVVVVVVVVVVLLLIVIGVVVVLQHRRIRTKEEYKPVDRMELNMDQIETTQTVPSTSSTKKTTGYEDIDLDDTDMKFKILSDEETIAKVKQHNKEYLKKQKEDEEREKDNPTQPPQAAVYACVNKPKSTVTTENKPPAGQEEEDVYEESKEGLYDTSGDRRHKENITVENYDSTENLKNEESDHNDLFPEKNSQIGANINKTYGSSEKKEEKRQVATVSPTFRLSSSSQGDGQKHKSDEIQPKTEKQTTHETSL